MGLRVVETHHAAHQRLPWHVHENACLAVLLEGSFIETFRTGSVECEVPTALFKPAGEAHANDYGGRGARCLCIEFLPAEIDHLTLQRVPTDQVVTLRAPEVMRLATRMYEELRRQDAFSPLVLEGLVFELTGATFRHKGVDSIAVPARWLRATCRRLHDDFGAKLTVASLAAEAGVHPDHLSRCFRQQYGVLIGQYLRRIRLEWAATQIATTTVPLVQIALRAGFSDQCEFTRRFHEHAGTTPARYRSGLARRNQPS
jgi:AraC family transcriptional regulator